MFHSLIGGFKSCSLWTFPKFLVFFFKIFSLQCVHVPFQIVRVSVFRGLHKDFWVKLYKDFWVKLYKDRFYFVSVVLDVNLLRLPLLSEGLAWQGEPQEQRCLPQQRWQQPSASASSSRTCSRTGGSVSGTRSWIAGEDTCSQALPQTGGHGSSWGTWQTQRGNPCRELLQEWTSSFHWSSRISVFL